MIDDDFLIQIGAQPGGFAQPLPSTKGGVALSLSAKTMLKQWLDTKLDEIRAAETVEEAQQLIDALPPEIAECIKVESKD